MVLGSFQCRGVLLLWHMVGQGPAVLAAVVGWPSCVFVKKFSSNLSYLPFLMPYLLGDGWRFGNIVVCCYNPAVVVSYYRRRAR